MGTETFADLVRQKRGCAVIVAGSDSDRAHVEKIIASLEGYRVPYEVRVCSAHKTPAALAELVREYEELGGALAYVAVAGGTDALSGALSFLALAPVISCPPDPGEASCLRNPPGSSNATVLDARNVGRFIAQLYSPYNPECRQALRRSREDKARALAEKDRELRAHYTTPGASKE
jgi:5-(carboxyamino)imidazole ribonucleotide mutase